ncbi:hypothetical protein JMN32_26785 [Fulvivirga sp. 29W222]|uniref:Uncharacterized protein n=1 Tax=Fulvivirga marina TaxID=2494733 RepID=A0A937G4N2_9BACT|nr:hypothetical protein [Fulvivirga marina]MBL6449948.1 hypothetical protein [Fulvivirga marina]
MIDYDICDYDYFSLEDYEHAINISGIETDENLSYLNSLKEAVFLIEIDLGIELENNARDYLPSFTNFIAQSISKEFSCKSISHFKPLHLGEEVPISLFVNGVEELDFTITEPNGEKHWRKVAWVKNKFYKSNLSGA